MILKKDKVDALLAKLAETAAVYVPQDVSGSTRYVRFAPGDTPLLDGPNTTVSPKGIVLPQCQSMYRYGTKGAQGAYIDPITDESPRVAFGVRPCDVRAIECLDDVFVETGYLDEFYQGRRANTLVVALGCTEAAPTCFCESMGLDPAAAPAADIMLHDTGDAYAVAAQTDAGGAALEAWKEFLADGEATPLEGAHCTLSVNAENLKARIDALADSDALWDAMSIKCLNCGACTFLCPTCYCFDIDQANRKNEGVRFRCWDSCMFSEYTEMAGGHNPRPTKRDRVQNRFMHKLSYFEDRYGKMLCVGCGRCVAECPVALDITVLIDRIGELAHD